MKTLWFLFQSTFTALGGFLGWFLGGLDGFLYALIAFVAADYLTGVLAAIAEKRLSSSAGFTGIARKILIFTLVGLANLLDVYVLGAGAVLRTATNGLILTSVTVCRYSPTSPSPEPRNKSTRRLAILRCRCAPATTSPSHR